MAFFCPSEQQPNLSIWTSPFAQREADLALTQGRLQLYIRPQRVAAGAGPDGSNARNPLLVDNYSASKSGR